MGPLPPPRDGITNERVHTVLGIVVIQFEHPIFLLALAALAPFLLYASWKSYADLKPRRKLISLILRAIALACIVFALSKPVLTLRNTDEAVLFVVDVSDSVAPEALDDAVDTIQKQTASLGYGQSAGVILFAGKPNLAFPLERRKIELNESWKRKIFHRRERDRIAARIRELERGDLKPNERSELDKLQIEKAEIESWRKDAGVDDTNLESACRLARATLPAEARRRIVMFSDGNGTRGDMTKEMRELSQAAVSVHSVALKKKDVPEVLAEGLNAPAEAQVKAPFDLEFTIQSNRATDAEVRIFRNKFLIATRDLALKEGKNVLEIPKLTLEEGFHEFEAVVSAKQDTILENNIARTAVRVAGRPKVLLVERESAQARYLEDALTAAEIQVEVRPPGGIPAEMNDLLNYDVLIFSDISADQMTLPQMDMVKRYVREMGGGFIMIGGEHSFGLGGYYRTPIEETLPVKMPIRKNIEKPNLALVLVIDKSGSMEGQKIEVAKEAALASAEVLKPNDQFGVVAFDSLAQWLCELTSASEFDAISQRVARLVAGGGTNIYPGLYDAYQALQNSDAKLKHIILMTDGVTEGSGYEELASHIAADEITLSTIGIGEDADQKFLQDLASAANGEFYFTNDFNTIPQILTKETLRASKSMLVEEPFVPKLVAKCDAVKGVDLEKAPFLLGYVATQAKETATVALRSDYGDPIFAFWRYGLGHSAAFTSDAKARWAGDWIGWEYFSKFWGQMIRSVMSTGAHKDLRSRSRVSVQDGVATITLDVRGRVGEFRDDVQPDVSLVETGAEPKGLEVKHIAPGLFTAEFPIAKYGEFYRFMVVHRQNGEPVDVRALAVTESYSPEFKNPLPNELLLKELSKATSGIFDPKPEQYWAFEGEAGRTPQDTWWWWLVAAAILLPIDIATRRLGV
ncbi:MAG: VWA domain-containing protein [Planctomycetes bacterium]|nr:VWA domain-containing protein [Planctomycetota bacterium]